MGLRVAAQRERRRGSFTMRCSKLFVASAAALALGGCLTFNVGQADPRGATADTGATEYTGATGRTGAKGNTSGDTVVIVPAR